LLREYARVRDNDKKGDERGANHKGAWMLT
jgi:hypothetical protein